MAVDNRDEIGKRSAGIDPDDYARVHQGLSSTFRV
jgi:hypothetical protein